MTINIAVPYHGEKGNYGLIMLADRLARVGVGSSDSEDEDLDFKVKHLNKYHIGEKLMGIATGKLHTIWEEEPKEAINLVESVITAFTKGGIQDLPFTFTPNFRCSIYVAEIYDKGIGLYQLSSDGNRIQRKDITIVNGDVPSQKVAYINADKGGIMVKVKQPCPTRQDAIDFAKYIYLAMNRHPINHYEGQDIFDVSPDGIELCLKTYRTGQQERISKLKQLAKRAELVAPIHYDNPTRDTQRFCDFVVEYGKIVGIEFAFKKNTFLENYKCMWEMLKTFIKNRKNLHQGPLDTAWTFISVVSNLTLMALLYPLLGGEHLISYSGDAQKMSITIEEPTYKGLRPYIFGDGNIHEMMHVYHHALARDLKNRELIQSDEFSPIDLAEPPLFVYKAPTQEMLKRFERHIINRIIRYEILGKPKPL